jgi:oxalate decarboxylase/phosphoglucose isomerase-like protein (cupin superfamily)
MFTSQTEILFPTEIYFGTIDLNDKLIYDLKKWIEIQKLLEEDLSTYSTTNNGWQYAFKYNDIQPEWHKSIISQVDSDFYLKNKSSWIVDYEIGGYQDPHIHRSSQGTMIINLVGSGDLLLYDTRTTGGFEVKTLNPGDWVYIPGWLMHSSRPCKDKRSILVIDYK